mmetsp:Transcript_22957/g.43713  ORF Transcript_22957/g.43713 Transcript_22957/m.43713 type:complete len:240 (+) Transcript_22957:342-1061(+)
MCQWSVTSLRSSSSKAVIKFRMMSMTKYMSTMNSQVNAIPSRFIENPALSGTATATYIRMKHWTRSQPKRKWLLGSKTQWRVTSSSSSSVFRVSRPNSFLLKSMSFRMTSLVQMASRRMPHNSAPERWIGSCTGSSSFVTGNRPSSMDSSGKPLRMRSRTKFQRIHVCLYFNAAAAAASSAFIRFAAPSPRLMLVRRCISFLAVLDACRSGALECVATGALPVESAEWSFARVTRSLME